MEGNQEMLNVAQLAGSLPAAFGKEKKQKHEAAPRHQEAT